MNCPTRDLYENLDLDGVKCVIQNKENQAKAKEKEIRNFITTHYNEIHHSNILINQMKSMIDRFGESIQNIESNIEVLAEKTSYLDKEFNSKEFNHSNATKNNPKCTFYQKIDLKVPSDILNFLTTTPIKISEYLELNEISSATDVFLQAYKLYQINVNSNINPQTDDTSNTQFFDSADLRALGIENISKLKPLNCLEFSNYREKKKICFFFKFILFMESHFDSS